MAKKHPKRTKIDRILDQNIAKIRRKRALKNNNRPIILNNIMLFEVITELDSVVRGGATGKTKELAQNMSAKARRLARDRNKATKERLAKIKNIRKKLEEKQKEEALKLRVIREERISMLKSEIAAIDKKIAAASHRKEIENRSIKKTKLETKLRILTKDMASNRPLKTQIELEKRVKQAIAIEEAEEGIDKLLEKIAEMQRTNKDNKWEEEIARATQQMQNTEQESSKSAQNLLDFLDKQFYSNIWQQKLEAEKEDYVQGTRIPQLRGSAAAAEEPTYTVPRNIAPYWEKQPEVTAEPEAEPEAGAEKSPKEQALESVSKIEDPSLRKFAFINNFLIGPNGASLQDELATSATRYDRRYGSPFRAQLQAIMKYLISLQQQAEKMLGEPPQGLSSSNLGTNPRLKQLAPELSEENLDAANKIYRDLWMKNVVSYKDLIATVVDLHIKGALRGKGIRAFFEDNVSKYAKNPMLLKQYEQKQRPQANESKKTISDITDQLMEQLYDTLN